MAWFGKSYEQKPDPPQAAEELFCSFCRHSQRAVKKLIAGPEVWICDACVRLCMDIVEDKVPKDTTAEIPSPPPSLDELRATLDLRCAGLDAAKRSLLAALSLHLARLQEGAPELRPPIIMLVGPRGSGKSHLARELVQLTRLPGHHADINRLSATGYVGLDVENLLWELVRQSHDDYRLGECGVLVLDGLHRVACAEPPPGSPRDIAGESVQRDILRVIEGMRTEVQGHSPRHPSRAAEPFWCHRLLVVLTATFDDLPQGDQAQREFLAERGLLRELLARVDRFVTLPTPSPSQLRAVLTTPERGLLPQRLAALEALGLKVQVDDHAIEAMLALAGASPDGAWALHRPLARMAEAASELDHAEPLVVDAETVRGWMGP